MSKPIFPKWFNLLRPGIGLGLVATPVYLTGLIWYGLSPKTLNAGYQPEQPIPYSHALHAGQLGIDCRYCHSTVENAAMAAIPTTDICLNCHNSIHIESEALEPLRQSHESGMPVEWNKIHDLPDYVYFNHSAHVTRGVGCNSCHGRIDQMEVVYQKAPLSMGWCLECHRNPEMALRPKDKITQMDWKAPRKDDNESQEDAQRRLGTELRAQYHINPSTDCSTCHR